MTPFPTPRLVLAGCLALLGASAAPAQEAGGGPVEVAVFDFELIDTSAVGAMTGPQAEEAARLDALGEALREAYQEAPGYRVVDVGPAREEASRRSLRNCGGCARGLADALGAEIAVTGTVQKVSNLILNVNVYVEDAQGAERAYSADIRGNTDESWRRGLDWLIRNRLELRD